MQLRTAAAESGAERALTVTLCTLRFAIPAPALTSDHQVMLSFYQRQLLHFVAFRAVFLTQQEFKTKKFALIPRFLKFLISFSEAVHIDSVSSPLQ